MLSFQELQNKYKDKEPQKTAGPSTDDPLYQKYREAVEASKPKVTGGTVNPTISYGNVRENPVLQRKTNTTKTYAQALEESRSKARTLESGARLPEVIPAKGDVSKLILPDTGGGGTVNPTLKQNETRTNYDYMTDREAAVYKYYRDRGQVEKAKKYLDALSMDVNQRAAARQKEDAKKLAEESTAAALYARAVSNVGQAAGAVYSAVMEGADKTVDPYHPLMGGVNVNEGLQEGLVGDSTGLGKFAKEAGLAVFDWGTQAAALGPLTPYVMAAGAMAGNTKDALERGSTTDEAVNYGILGGAAEAITEKIGYDRWLKYGADAIAKKLGHAGLFELSGKIADKGALAKFLWEVMPHGGSEGLEEATSELANIVADTLIMGDNSQMKQIAQTAMENGKTESEAIRTALIEGMKQVAYSGAVGAASGGAIAGGIGGLSRMSGRNVLERGGRESTQQEAAQRAEVMPKVGNPLSEAENPLSAPENVLLRAENTSVKGERTETRREEVSPAVRDFGEKYYYAEGQKMVNEEAAARGDTSFLPAFQTYYTAGLTGVQESGIQQTAETAAADKEFLNRAYLAGVNDRKADLEARMKGTGKMGQTAGVFLETEAVTEAQRSFAELVSKEAELEVVLRETLPEDQRGYYESGKGRVTIAVDSGQFAGTVFHELAHYINEANPEGYDRLRQAVFSAAAAMEGSDLDGYIRKYEARYTKAYQNAGQTVAYDMILEEMTADALGELAGDETSLRAFVEELQKGDPTILEKIREFLDRLLESLKALVNDGRFSSFGEELKKDIAFTEKLAKTLAEETKKAGEKQRGEKENSGNEAEKVLYSVRKDAKGKEYWHIDTQKDIFRGVKSIRELKKRAYDYILHGEKGEEVETLIQGERLKFIRISADEFVYGRQSKSLAYENYKRKMRMAPSVADLITHANVEWKAPDKKNHKAFSGSFLNYRGRVGIDHVIFNYVVRIGERKGEHIFYDINLEADPEVPGTEVRLSYKNKNDLPLNENIPQAGHKDNGKTEKTGKRFSFAGERARTADREKLEQAKRMEEEGKTRREIYDETGWFRGADDKWRFEIDDSQMQYRYAGVPGISAYLQNTELFEAYPELRNVNLRFEKLEKGEKGYYDRQKNEIVLDDRLREAPGSVLLHEIQHAIQKIEGHAAGATPEFWESKIEKGFDTRTAEEKAREQNLRKRLEEMRKKEPDFYREMEKLDKMVPDVPRGEVDWDTLEQIEEDPAEWKAYDARRDSLEEKYGEEKVWAYFELKYELEQSRKGEGRTAFDLYHATAGEIEARDTQRRMEFTEADRKAWFPNIGDEDTVFAEDAGGTRFSLRDDSKGRELSEEQKKYFAESKAVDRSGRLLTLYHQTEGVFTVFDTRRIGAGTRDSETPFGIFLKTSPDDIGLKGKKQMELYANIRNPLKAVDRADLRYQLTRLSPEYDRLSEEEKRIDVEYKIRHEKAKEELEAYIAEWRKEHPQAVRTEIYDDAEFQRRYDAEDLIVDQWEQANTELARKAKETITSALEKNGYDGIILQMDRGSFGRKTDAYIALHPEQVKRTDNLNPTDDADIRFSIREEEYAALVEENDTLREANDALRRQFEITKDAVHDPVSAKKAARKWLKAHDSGYDAEKFAQRFLSLADYVANAGDKVDFQKVMGALQKLAYDALSESRVLNTELSDAYKDFKTELRNTKIKVTEDMAEEMDYYGGYNTFRKENFGKLSLSRKSGAYADIFYQEMAEKYPELLDVERVRTQTDMIVDLLETADSLQPIYENPYGMNLDEYAMDAAYDLWEMYFDIELQKPTFADKYEKKLEKEKARAKAARENMRKDLKVQYEERLRQAKEDQKKKLEDTRLAAAMHEGRALTEQRRAIYEKMKERNKARRDREAYAKYKNIIEKGAALLKRWLERPTDQYHVQESMMEGVKNFLEKMKFDDPELNIMPTDIRRMTKDYQAMTAENTMLYAEEDENVQNMLEALADRVGDGVKVSELGPEEMRQLSVVIRSVSHLVRNANRMVSLQNGQKISEIGNAYMDGMKNKRSKNPEGRLRVLSDLMNAQMLDTESFFREMGKTVHDTIYRGLREGFDRKILHVKEAAEFMQKTVDKKKIRAWSEMTPKEYDLSGGKILLTDAQIMSLYCLMRRTQARGHIFGGGIKGAPVVQKVKGQPKIVKNTKPVTVTAEDVRKMMDSLTEEQKEAALKIQEYLEQAGSWGNEVSMTMLGYRKFTETNYFPIVTDENYVNTIYGAKGEKNSTLKNAGTTQHTKKNATNPIILENIFDAYVRHIDFMSSYNAFVPALSDLNKFLNYRKISKSENGKVFGENASVKETLKRVMGPAGDRYIQELMERLNNPARKDDTERLPRIFLRNMKIASVGANLRVVIQQPVSYLRAADVIGTPYLLGALIPSRTDFEKIYTYAPIALWKEWGNYEMNAGRTMKELLVGQNFYESFLEKSMAAAGIMDKLTWGRIWKAAELETRKKYPELKENRFYEKVGQRFTEIIDGTQVVDSVLHRNQMMRSGSLFTQMATSFMSEPTKTYNMMRNSMVAVMKDNTPENRKKVIRTFLTLTANGVCVAAAAGLVDMLRDDDEEKTMMEKWLQAFRGDYSQAEGPADYILAAVSSNLGDNFNPLNFVPYAKDILSVIQGYTVQRTDISWLNDLVKSAKNLMRYMEGDSGYTLNAVLMDAAGSLSKATGVPINSAKRDILAIKNTIVNYTLGLEAQYENKKLTYAVGSEKNAAMYVKMMLEAKMSGNDEIATRIYNDMVRAGVSNETIDNKIKSQQVAAIKEEADAVEAAEAYNEGRAQDYLDAVERLRKKGYFAQNIESAVKSLARPEEEKEETFDTITEGYWKDTQEAQSADYTLLFNAFMEGSASDYDMMWQMLKEGGKEDNSIRSSMRSRLKEAYWQAREDGDSQRAQKAAAEFYRLGGKKETLEKAN